MTADEVLLKLKDRMSQKSSSTRNNFLRYCKNRTGKLSGKEFRQVRPHNRLSCHSWQEIWFVCIGECQVTKLQRESFCVQCPMWVVWGVSMQVIPPRDFTWNCAAMCDIVILPSPLTDYFRFQSAGQKPAWRHMYVECKSVCFCKGQGELFMASFIYVDLLITQQQMLDWDKKKKEIDRLQMSWEY